MVGVWVAFNNRLLNHCVLPGLSSLSFFFFCQQINYRAVRSTLDAVSHIGRDKRRGRRKSPGVNAAHNGVWHFSHLRSLSAPTALLLLHRAGIVLLSFTPHQRDIICIRFYLWLSSACSNKISQSCRGVLLTDRCHGHTCLTSVFLGLL